MRHKAALYRLILTQVRDADEALDLVQESFVAAHGALGRFDETRSLRAWLSRIALNKCRDWARRRRVRAMLARVLPVEAAAEVADDRIGARRRRSSGIRWRIRWPRSTPCPRRCASH